jgi:hypothetical protein
MLDYRIYRPDQLRTVAFFAIAQVHVAILQFYTQFPPFLPLCKQR